MRRFVSRRRRSIVAGLLPVAGAASAISILTGSISAQITPPQATTRAWDGSTAATGTFNWTDAVNWAGDILPGTSEIAAFPAPNGTITIDLGGTTQEVGSLYLGTAGGSANYIFQNGTLVTNNLDQNQADPNALTPTLLLQSKNGGTDVILATVSSDTLQLQGKVTSGGLWKYGAGTLRLGTSGTDFNNAINGDIVIYGGTLAASAGATPGINNPLAGTGDVVIGAPNVTLNLQGNAALATNVDYDFVRNIRAGNNNFTINATLAAGTDAFDPNMRAGTLFIGDATVTMSQNSGFRVALDGLNIAAGATKTRLQANALTFIDSLLGDSAANFYKRGGSDVEVRTTNGVGYAGNVYLGESNTRFVSTAAGLNPLGGPNSTVYFSNGYGLSAIDGGQTLQLRADVATDFASNIAFRPGVTIGRIDVNRAGASATGVTLSVGNVSLGGQVLRVLGGNTFRLAVDDVTLTASSTLDTASADLFVNGTLTVPATATLTKLGGNTMTLNANNQLTSLGPIVIRAGTVTGAVAGSLGSAPITVGLAAPDSNGFYTAASRLNINAAGALANTTGTDVTVLLGGTADLNITPSTTDTFDIRSGGRLQGSAGQLSAVVVGTNLTLDTDAIIVHENPGATTATVGNLPNTASVFYGIAATANSLPNVGVGTPWKGVTGDNTARTIQGSAVGTPAVFNATGDNDPNSVDVYVGSMFGVNLSLGTTAAGDGEFKWSSSNGNKVTLSVRGVGGSTTVGLVPGGGVGMNETNAVSGLSTAVDKIYVDQGALILFVPGVQGGVPIEVRGAGALDLGNVAGNVVDGPVVIKDGGVFYFNDNQVLGGTGTITFESGSKLDITGGAPNTFFTTATNPLSFAGATNMTVRFAASEIAELDTRIPDLGATYVVAGGATAAVLGPSNANVTTNTQSAGITIQNGVLTNDGTSRGFTGPINLNNSNFTIAATRNTILATTSTIATTGNIQVGSNTAIDFRDKNANPDRVSGLGLLDPYNSHSEVLFLGPVTVGGSMTVANGTRLGFADANTNIAGDLTFNGTALYLDGGGELSGGSSTKGDLTARLTDTTGLAANRVANKIILGNYARAELSVLGAGPHTVTQPFVITGQVNPIDKRTFWIDRADTAGTPSVFLSDVLLKPNAEFGIDESNTVVRTNLRLEGNATLVRNHDDYDLRNLTKEAGSPANITLTAGQAAAVWNDTTEYFFNGSNAVLTSTVDGTVDAGITIDLARAQFFFEQNAVLNGTIRAQTAVAGGDAFIVSRSSGLTTNTEFNGTGQIQIGRSAAANGPEDFDIRPTEVATGSPAQQHTVNVPVRVVDDGVLNIDGVVRSERHNDSNVTGLAVLTTLNVDPGATVQTISSNQTRLTLPTVNLGANSGIDSNNSTSVFLGNLAGGANTIRLSGPAQARITGNITAGQVNVTGAGLDFDPGAGSTSTVNAPIALSGLLSVRSGSADLGSQMITGAVPQVVAGLRENKTQGSFDLTTPNTSNEVKLGPVLAQVAANVGWGENQTATYTGQILIPDNGTAGDGLGSVAFAKWFDDSISIVVDGTTVLRNQTFNDGVANATDQLSVGWHDIEIRLGQGTGGSGPVGQDGNVNNLGLGIDVTTPVSTLTAGGVGVVLDGSHYVAPLDNGTMSLFRTTTVKSNITLAANTNLTAGGFTSIGTVNVGSGAALSLTAAAASSADTLNVNSGVGSTLNVGLSGGTLSVGVVDLQADLTKTGAGNVVFTGAGTGFGSVLVNQGSVTVDGSLPGNVILAGGALRGSGSVIGNVDSTAGGTIAPGTGTGVLTIGGLNSAAGTTFAFDLARGATGPVAGTTYDQLKVTGFTLDLGGAAGNATGPMLSLQLGPGLLQGDIFTIILNQGFDTDTGTFAGLANGALINQSGYQFQISYFDDPLTPSFETSPGDGGKSVSLLVTIPEPSALVGLLGGMGVLAGLRRFRRSA